LCSWGWCSSSQKSLMARLRHEPVEDAEGNSRDRGKKEKARVGGLEIIGTRWHAGPGVDS
jgi:hypothetical protein